MSTLRRVRTLAATIAATVLVSACSGAVGSGASSGERIDDPDALPQAGALPIAAAAGDTLVMVSNPMGADARDRSAAAARDGDGVWHTAPPAPLAGSRALGSTGDSVVLLGADEEGDTMSAHRWSPGDDDWHRIDWADAPSVGVDVGVVLVGSAAGRSVFATHGGMIVVGEEGAVEDIPDTDVRGDRTRRIAGRCVSDGRIWEASSPLDVAAPVPGLFTHAWTNGPVVLRTYSMEGGTWSGAPLPPGGIAEVAPAMSCLPDGPVVLTDHAEHTYDADTEQWRTVPLERPLPVGRGGQVALGGGTDVAWAQDGSASFVDPLSGTVLRRTATGNWAPTATNAAGVVAVGDDVVGFRRGEVGAFDLPSA